MIRIAASRLGTLAAMVVLTMGGACGRSPPSRFIDLETVPPRGQPPALAGLPVCVGQVQLPPELDRPALVRRLGKSRLDITETVRWGASLGALVQRTLALDVARRLPLGRVVLPGEPTPRDGVRLFLVTFETFSAGPDHRVTLKAWWWLVDDQTRAVLVTRESEISVPIASDLGSDIAGAMSAALGQLADQMVQAVAAKNAR